jgi:hypothetical protein
MRAANTRPQDSLALMAAESVLVPGPRRLNARSRPASEYFRLFLGADLTTALPAACRSLTCASTLGHPPRSHPVSCSISPRYRILHEEFCRLWDCWAIGWVGAGMPWPDTRRFLVSFMRRPQLPGRGPTAPRDDVLEGTPKPSDSGSINTQWTRRSWRQRPRRLSQLSSPAAPRRLAACLHRINPNGFVCICLSPDVPAQRHRTIHYCSHTTPTNQTLTEPLLRETLPSAVIPRPRQILYFETPPARLQDLAGVRTMTQGREFPPGCDELSKTVNLRRMLSGQSEEVERMSRWCGPAFLVLNPDRAILSRQREQ